jgi:hypothetical protein
VRNRLYGLLFVAGLGGGGGPPFLIGLPHYVQVPPALSAEVAQGYPVVSIPLGRIPPPKERKSAKGKPIKKIIKYAKSAIRLTFRCRAGGGPPFLIGLPHYIDVQMFFTYIRKNICCILRFTNYEILSCSIFVIYFFHIFGMYCGPSFFGGR